MKNDSSLFHNSELSDVFLNEERNIKSEINEYAPNKLLNTSDADLCKYFYNKYSVESLTLNKDGIWIDHDDVKLDVSRDQSRWIIDRSAPVYVTGTRVEFHIPYAGDKALFYCTPSTRYLVIPKGKVTENELLICIETLEHSPDAMRREFENQYSTIEDFVKNIAADVFQWNEALRGFISAQIKLRKDKILNDQGLVAGLGFPMKRTMEDVMTFATPVVRRKIPIQQPIACQSPYKPEPVLSNAEYDHIIHILNQTALMLERNPTTFRHMDEEALRDQFLVPLNSHYEGQVTGETFNASGKTDIIIKAEERNIFIVECKIWKGTKVFTDAINQLLNYLTWRDIKTALMIFNRNKDLTAVLDQIPGIVSQHSNYKRDLKRTGETEFRYVFSQAGDISREIYLTVLVYDIPG